VPFYETCVHNGVLNGCVKTVGKNFGSKLTKLSKIIKDVIHRFFFKNHTLQFQNTPHCN